MKMRTNAVLVALVLLAYFSGLRTVSAFYDPGTQRWLNRDPIQEIGGLNLYEFVHNRPTIDRDALGWISLFTCEEASRRAEQALQKWIDDSSEVNWFNYIIAEAIKADACSPPGPPPNLCPEPNRYPTGPKPPPFMPPGSPIIPIVPIPGPGRFGSLPGSGFSGGIPPGIPGPGWKYSPK